MHRIPANAFQLKSNQQRFKQPVRLKVAASPHGYYYCFRNRDNVLICPHVGLLPEGYEWDKPTAELFALAEAARRFYSDEELRDYRIASVCCSLPFAYNRPIQRRQAA